MLQLALRDRTRNLFLPEESDVQAQIRKLEARLREAVRAEEYEAAAEYRDQIRALKEAQA